MKASLQSATPATTTIVTRVHSPITVLLAIALPVASCTDASAPSTERIDERRVSPGVVNDQATRWSDDHLVWVRAGQPARGLMVLLTGTNGQPASNRLIGRIAAEQGYHVIGLMYPNDIAVVQACANDSDPRCMEHMRREIVEGTDVSPHVAVNRANSIDGRLADLLSYLAAAAPGEGWDTFLDAEGRPQWSRVAVAGLSQGGGHAAFIGILRAVPRVVMFGAPADGYNAEVAPWMQVGATPAARYYGLRHERDPFHSIEPNWLALGLGAFGEPQDVDEDDDYAGSHMLVTDLVPATGTYAHAHPSVFVDGVVPIRPDGSPVLAAAWRYLLGMP